MKRKMMKVTMLFGMLVSSLLQAETDPLLDKSLRVSFERLISKEQIEKKVKEAAAAIDNELQGEPLTIVMIMKGALCITADLMRQLNNPCTLEYIQTSSYGARGSNQGDLVISGLDKLDIKDKNVLIVDDIFDTGVTLSKVVQKIQELQPKSLRSLVLLSKKVPHKTNYRPDYILFEIENRFVIGYGMDYKEHWRELPDVCAVK